MNADFEKAVAQRASDQMAVRVVASRDGSKTSRIGSTLVALWIFPTGIDAVDSCAAPPDPTVVCGFATPRKLKHAARERQSHDL